MQLRSIFYVLLMLVPTACAPLPLSTVDPQFDTQFRGFAFCSVDVVHQSEPYSCGVACLSAVLQYWGIECSERDLLADYPSSSDQGYPLLSLKQIAEAKGITAYALQFDGDPRERLLEQVRKGRPIICALRFPKSWYVGYRIPLFGPIYRALTWWFGSDKSHFVVVLGFDDDEVLFIDPSYGYASLPFFDFEHCWRQMGFAAVLCSG